MSEAAEDIIFHFVALIPSQHLCCIFFQYLPTRSSLKVQELFCPWKVKPYQLKHLKILLSCLLQRVFLQQIPSGPSSVLHPRL